MARLAPMDPFCTQRASPSSRGREDGRALIACALPKRAAAHLDEAPAREAASGAGEAGGSNTSAPLQAAATLREEEEEAPEEAAVASVKGQLRFLMSAEAEAAIADDGGL